jgi:hypothetical protein
MYLAGKWPSDVDLSTASAHVNNDILTLTVQHAPGKPE